ncbi:arp2/3 complex-activating protein rickA-like [Helianthus annuus]|uniref:arp2/3 complex-activating protein rickA-like n=1 Tax=Helianthus annuus TaxID=4232 RepID=UPI000B902207|nr:arp2/3 complex-activating protein rickA-like [Helianthus annuus]
MWDPPPTPPSSSSPIFITSSFHHHHLTPPEKHKPSRNLTIPPDTSSPPASTWTSQPPTSPTHPSSDNNSTTTTSVQNDVTPTPKPNPKPPPRPPKMTPFPVRDDCWSEDTTFTLIENHWQEVVDAVNNRRGVDGDRVKQLPEDDSEASGDAYYELAGAIGRFADVYKRVEETKQKEMVELEKQRMEFTKDMDIGKMKLLMESQVQLRKLMRSKKNSDTGMIN